MRHSRSTGKLNAKFIHTSFRTVEDYEKETQTISDIERKFGHNKTPILRLRKKSIKSPSEISKFNDTFHNLSLQKQIEIMMEPIVHPRINTESPLMLLEDKEAFNADDTQKLANQSPRLKINNSPEDKGLFQKIKSQISSAKSIKFSRQNTNLPPINESDNLNPQDTTKYWHYHHMNKHDPLNPININNTNISGVQNSFDKTAGETGHSFDRLRVNLKQVKSTPLNKNSLLLNEDILRDEQNTDTRSTSYAIRFNRDNRINLSLNKKDLSNETSLLTRVSNMQVTSFLENSKEQRDIANSDSKQKVSSYDLKIDPYHNFLDDSNTNNQSTSFTSNVQKVSPKANRKKDFYNKWYVPVKYWKVSKDLTPLETKYEELRKDTNYFYHNLHNYESQKSTDPSQPEVQKSAHQVSFESLQQVLKRNVIIKKYKKQLVDTESRIPSFLKSIE